MKVFCILIIYLFCAKAQVLNLRTTLKDINSAATGNVLTTSLDTNFRGIFLQVRRMFTQNSKQNYQNQWEMNRKVGKLQQVISKTNKFPCALNNTRSLTPPTSVHQLRPGDIDIIASIGDSLSAGNGILGATVYQMLSENRGVTFAGGGQNNWRSVLTLPNILKVFNPNLYGYATGDSMTVEKESHLNIAEPMIMSRDLFYQVKVLIKRMRADKNVNMQKHWKLLTIFVGNNDVCTDMCHYRNESEFLVKHERDLRDSLTILRNHVPRMVVNLLPVPNLATSLFQMRNLPVQCNAVHFIGCHCLFGADVDQAQLKRAKRIIKQWQGIDQYVAALPEFNTDDFTVIYQPLTTNITLPTLPNGECDMRYFAVDCFHFSQRGHAAVANTLWNNMLQFDYEKDNTFSPAFEKVLCPSAERPFIATLKNSHQKKLLYNNNNKA